MINDMTDAPKNTEHERRWLGREAAATYLGCTSRTIDRLAQDGLITRYKVGVLARFDAREIDAMVMSGADSTRAVSAGATRVE